MPIYEYACDACKHELEIIQKMSDEPETVCPSCGEETLKKRISAAGFRLKGGGWYETDFKNSTPPASGGGGGCGGGSCGCA
ncbi:FmdB family zinc ribbon protein [Candidatus Venteria ishoeyi]|uniref:Zinc ribbon domain protein n=1 Tax=Candidatus Venteria ishoeyi TaxID=1899563 RepID=A0A1H6F492_9GAMM|nr:zinc ribbon domain-containing protein [Candidatus Venteria ishoeyi]MDM8545822.1 zinc ribbon domain-containing protein [Candidatus Venteria ishoeyi]SEH04977.1 Zinc ribbon domain protein [Candidatus Venteria ishoeyi]